MEMNAMDKLTYVLVVIGGLNWGLVGFFKYNLVDSAFGDESALSRVVYVLVGVSAVYMLVRMMTMMSSTKE